MTEHSALVRRGTLVVATRDDSMVAALRALNGELDLDLDIVNSKRELLGRLSPRNGLPHEGDAGWIKILLLDDDLGDARGRELIRPLREVRSDLKIIFTTSRPTPNLEVEVRREGVHFFLPKPIEPGNLKKIVTKAVEHESTRNRWKKG